MTTPLHGENFSLHQEGSKYIAKVTITTNDQGQRIRPIEITQTYSGQVDEATAEANLKAVAAKMVALADLYKLGKKTDVLTLQENKLTKHYTDGHETTVEDITKDITEKFIKYTTPNPKYEQKLAYAHTAMKVFQLQDPPAPTPTETILRSRVSTELPQSDSLSLLQQMDAALNASQAGATTEEIRISLDDEPQTNLDQLLRLAEQLRKADSPMRLILQDDHLQFVPIQGLLQTLRNLFGKIDQQESIAELIKTLQETLKSIDHDTLPPESFNRLSTLIDFIRTHDTIKGDNYKALMKEPNMAPFLKIFMERNRGQTSKKEQQAFREYQQLLQQHPQRPSPSVRAHAVARVHFEPEQEKESPLAKLQQLEPLIHRYPDLSQRYQALKTGLEAPFPVEGDLKSFVKALKEALKGEFPAIDLKVDDPEISEKAFKGAWDATQYAFPRPLTEQTLKEHLNRLDNAEEKQMIASLIELFTNKQVQTLLDEHHELEKHFFDLFHKQSARIIDALRQKDLGVDENLQYLAMAIQFALEKPSRQVISAASLALKNINIDVRDLLEIIDTHQATYKQQDEEERIGRLVKGLQDLNAKFAQLTKEKQKIRIQEEGALRQQTQLARKESRLGRTGVSKESREGLQSHLNDLIAEATKFQDTKLLERPEIKDQLQTSMQQLFIANEWSRSVLLHNPDLIQKLAENSYTAPALFAFFNQLIQEDQDFTLILTLYNALVAYKPVLERSTQIGEIVRRKNLAVDQTLIKQTREVVTMAKDKKNYLVLLTKDQRPLLQNFIDRQMMKRMQDPKNFQECVKHKEVLDHFLAHEDHTTAFIENVKEALAFLLEAKKDNSSDWQVRALEHMRTFSFTPPTDPEKMGQTLLFLNLKTAEQREQLLFAYRGMMTSETLISSLLDLYLKLPEGETKAGIKQFVLEWIDNEAVNQRDYATETMRQQLKQIVGNEKDLILSNNKPSSSPPRRAQQSEEQFTQHATNLMTAIDRSRKETAENFVFSLSHEYAEHFRQLPIDELFRYDPKKSAATPFNTALIQDVNTLNQNLVRIHQSLPANQKGEYINFLIETMLRADQQGNVHLAKVIFMTLNTQGMYPTDKTPNIDEKLLKKFNQLALNYRSDGELTKYIATKSGPVIPPLATYNAEFTRNKELPFIDKRTGVAKKTNMQKHADSAAHFIERQAHTKKFKQPQQIYTHFLQPILKSEKAPQTLDEFQAKYPKISKDNAKEALENLGKILEQTSPEKLTETERQLLQRVANDIDANDIDALDLLMKYTDYFQDSGPKRLYDD